MNNLSFLDADKLYESLLNYNKNNEDKINFIFINNYDYSDQLIEDLKHERDHFYIGFNANWMINNQIDDFKVEFIFNNDSKFIAFANDPKGNIFDIKEKDIGYVDKTVTYAWKSNISLKESFNKIIEFITN